MNSIIDGMEVLLADAHKAKGWHWVYLEPMWTTWPMEKFGASISKCLSVHSKCNTVRQSLQSLTSVSFETSRKIANTWVEQPHLEEDSWDAKWEDLCEVEIDRWDNR